MRVVVLVLLLVCVDVQAAGLFASKPQVDKEKLDMCQKVLQKVEAEMVQHKANSESFQKVAEMKEAAARSLAETNDKLRGRIKELEAALEKAHKNFLAVEQGLGHINSASDIFTKQHNDYDQAVQQAMEILSSVRNI